MRTVLPSVILGASADSQWRKEDLNLLKHYEISPDLQQIPCIFLLQTASCRQCSLKNSAHFEFQAGVMFLLCFGPPETFALQ
jgi:hypothetical protein